MPSCRMLPHGSYSLIPAILTTMGWLASLFQDGCDYSKLTGDTVRAIATEDGVPYLEVGFAAYRQPTLDTKSGNWQVVYVGQCLDYPSGVPRGSYWTAAMVFDFLALVLGGSGSLFLWFTAGCIFSRGTWRWAGYEVLLACICQGLSFLWFRSDLCHLDGNKCELFWGSKADIVSTSLWAVAAVSIFCHYPVPKEARDNGDGLFVDANGNAIGPSGNTSLPSVEIQDNSFELETGNSNVQDSPAPTPEATSVSIGGEDQNSGNLQTSTGQSSCQDGEDRNLREIELS